MKKRWIISISVVLIILIGAGIWVIVDTQWKRDFTITYNDYDSVSDSKAYDIKNNTNNNFSNVYIVFEVKTWEGKTFTFEKIAFLTLEAGETSEYKLFDEAVRKELADRNMETVMWTTEIVKIRYKR